MWIEVSQNEAKKEVEHRGQTRCDKSTSDTVRLDLQLLLTVSVRLALRVSVSCLPCHIVTLTLFEAPLTDSMTALQSRVTLRTIP